VVSADLREAASGLIVVSEPIAPLRGTALVYSGGSGTLLWGAAVPGLENSEALYQETLHAWSEAGLRVVRVQWDEDWQVGVSELEGFAALACRPATVTNWVADRLVDPGQPFCIGGGSSGAAQVSYALTHYGLADRVSLAVPWGGFWMGRIDMGCLDSDPRNASLHYADAARGTIDRSYGFVNGTGPCLTRDVSFTSRFQDASVSAGPDFVYPHTLVWHVLAGGDNVGALAQGLTYYEAMLRAGSPFVRADVLPGLPHALELTQAGQAQIRDIFLQECRLR
jgi:hypothetical protein